MDTVEISSSDTSVRMYTLVWPALLIAALLLSGCGSSEDSTTNSGTGSFSQINSCADLTGTAWEPQIPGAANSNHSGNVTILEEVLTQSGPITGLGQSAGASREITVSIDMNQDLGSFGSLTLIGEVTNYPLSGGAFPILVSLSDGVNEFINLSRTGAGSDCAQTGYFVCTSGTCSTNSNCQVTWPSAYFSRGDWQQHQGIISSSAVNTTSVNTFPSCNWTGGTGQSSDNPQCPFTTDVDGAGPGTAFLDSGKLRQATYTAKYVLLADSYASLTGYNATLKVTAVRRKTSQGAVGGTVDLNVILVGSNNINASRTAIGKRNLNTLIKDVMDVYQQTNSQVNFGKVTAVEWPCDRDVDQFATTNINSLGTLLTQSSNFVSSSSEGKAINLVLVDSIVQSGSSGLTILGVSGAIGGPTKNGTSQSGFVVSTFGYLGSYNSACGSGTAICPKSTQDSSFHQLGGTIAHEMGHYLGLNHPSESSGSTHDFVLDTPICTQTSGLGYLTISSCRTLDSNTFPVTGNTCASRCSSYNANIGVFCSASVECQFNHLMWWSSKGFHEGSGAGDGDILSSESGKKITFHPLVQ